MTNADKIKQMNDKQLARFLWVWKINSITAFLANGGMGGMNGKDISDWLEETTDTFVCIETYVGGEWVFDQDFNLKQTEREDNE